MAGSRVGNLSAGRKPMSVRRIKEMRTNGMTCGEIGRALAKEDGRSMPYQAHSVETALRRERRREAEYAAYLQDDPHGRR